MDKQQRRIGFIGFGEAASAFAAGWNRESVASISAFDIKIDQPEHAATLAERLDRYKVTGMGSNKDTVIRSDAVVSLVSADQANAAASEAARNLAAGTLFIDGNSCSPQTKMRSSQAIGTVGGRYVDMAIMAPVNPLREKVPVLLAGEHADAAAELLTGLGMSPRIVGAKVGAASAIKLTRSIMIKGMEALFAECMLAARLGGVEEAVITSLEASDPDIAWRKRATYGFDRMTVHGQRRAAEMRESADMVAELGLPNLMATSTAQWQKILGDLPVQTNSPDVILNALGKG